MMMWRDAGNKRDVNYCVHSKIGGIPSLVYRTTQRNNEENKNN